MSLAREFVFDWLVNATVQIGLFALLAAGLLPLIAKAKAKYQYCFYLTVFALCLAAPVFNTLWHPPPSLAAEGSQPQARFGTEHRDHHYWDWEGRYTGQELSGVVLVAKTALLVVWLGLFIYQLVRFCRGIDRVHRLRREALSIPSGRIIMAGAMPGPPHDVVFLESGDIDDPVTVGVFHSAIIFPSKIVPALGATDFAAILAHEYGHICRKDFLVHLLCQFTMLPVAWHPGIQYLMSKISQTRELACDDYAAVRFGKRTMYARSLVRLASLCLALPRSQTIGLGIFDGDNLEDRIMMLTKKRTTLSRASLLGLALSTSILFGSSTVLAHEVSLHEATASTNHTQKFAGTWHWMFHGQSFATMILIENSTGVTGTVTASKIALDDAGELSKADPSDNAAPTPITKTKLEGNALHVTVMDDNQPFEFLVTLKDGTHAEIHPIGAPANMKPIKAERVN